MTKTTITIKLETDTPKEIIKNGMEEAINMLFDKTKKRTIEVKQK